ncbi:HDOD domain-containing protein [Pseudogulbenkiania ferrooxidans]|uniref:Putative signal transduction protein n=1 Tax=Pseudogulbenkiania ferrooxidans 2002 TaxID=279714 RepID=B9Z562_9NEIS|nr:HDOD domain-containing protein [Pseudogulbenkiania ferrooxidans]EEG08294.1 putative signal transduction protein [Pseudogulbenkiania ferrooxidans 2002]
MTTHAAPILSHDAAQLLAGLPVSAPGGTLRHTLSLPQKLTVATFPATRLKHPGIVPPSEQELRDGLCLWHYDLPAWHPLASLLALSGVLPGKEAVGLCCDLLGALMYAHAQGVAHGWLSLDHILLDDERTPHLLGLGLLPAPPANALPRMRQRDLAALAGILHQLLTGQPPGSTPLRQLNPLIDDELDAIMASALDTTPGQGFADAASLLAALQAWLTAQHRFIKGSASPTAWDSLLERMRYSADFPALSQAIQAINQVSEDHTGRVQELAEIILQDFSLTNKLLRVVNSVHYSHFGGAVSTVSRAIVILGFDTIRNLAITLLLFEHMHNKAHAATLKDTALRTFFCGLLTRELAQHGAAGDSEEALICGMFHHLGELLCRFYFREESRLIDLKVENGLSLTQATIHTLGLDFAALGMSVAEHWSFPARIVQSMELLPAGPIRPPASAAARLCILANLAAELTQLTQDPGSTPRQPLETLLERYQRVLPLNAEQAIEHVRAALRAFDEHVEPIGVSARPDSFLARLRGSALLAGSTRPGVRPPPLAQAIQAARPQELELDLMLDFAAVPEPCDDSSARRLSAGMQELTHALLGPFNLNELLQTVLETLFRATPFEHVLLCTRDPRLGQMVARSGFGERIGAMIPAFRFSLQESANVFCVALEHNADILIEDVNAPNIASRIPNWLRRATPAETFLILPLVLENKPIGCLYGERRHAHSLKPDAETLNLLKALRNQALLAIRQKQSAGGA